LEYKISEEIKRIESDYETGYINIMDGLTFSQWRVLRMCEFYANSQYLGSNTNDYWGRNNNKDELGRDAPFYNIVNFRVTLAKTATDLDIKDIDITSDDPLHYVKSMLLRKEAFEWMKEKDFSSFLNKMGYTRAKYGGVVVKKTEEKGDLKLEVVQWKNLITDQVEIIDNPIIEKHFMTYSALLKKRGVWENVEEVLKENKDKKKASKYGVKEISNRILVYEVTGEFPREYLLNAKDENANEDDEYEYTLQRYFIADVYGKSFILFADDLKESPYDYLPWETMEGRGLGRGVIEDSEEAQVWTNDAVKNEKNAMDLAGKVVLATTSKKLGNNILEVDNGKMFELEDGKDIKVLNLTPAALGQFQNQVQKWNEQASGATSSHDALTGEQPPSGTPYSQTALLNQVASKPFDYRREEAGIFISRLFTKWVIPHLVKKLKKSHTLATDFDEMELEMIDKDFKTSRANQKVIDNALNKHFTSQEEYDALIEIEELTGSKRFLDMPDNYFDGVETKVTVDPTGETKNKYAVLQSLSTLMADVIRSYNPNTGTFGVFDNPQLSKIFSIILELSGAGVSPASLGIGKPQKPTPQIQAQSGGGQPIVPPQAGLPVALPTPTQAPVAQ